MTSLGCRCWLFRWSWAEVELTIWRCLISIYTCVGGWEWFDLLPSYLGSTCGTCIRILAQGWKTTMVSTKNTLMECSRWQWETLCIYFGCGSVLCRVVSDEIIGHHVRQIKSLLTLSFVQRLGKQLGSNAQLERFLGRFTKTLLYKKLI